MSLFEYIEAHIDAEPPLLAHINRETHVTTVNPRMLSGHYQGRLLSLLSKMLRPKAILELGTFTGYSALCLAEGLVEGGVLHTIEANDEMAEFIVQNLSLSEHRAQIKLHIGRAQEVLKGIDERFDLVFIDADKREYLEYYHAVFEKVNVGGLIIVDNTLWDEKVLHEVAEKDKQSIAIKQFNDAIAADDRVEKLILPIRDGITLIRKK